MIRVLLVPSSDYLGHPFPQRHNQIFERLHDAKDFEVHVVRFGLFEKPKLKTQLIVHELSNTRVGSVSTYYLLNMVSHASEIRRIVRQESIDVVVLSNLAMPLVYTLMDELSSKRVPVIFDLPDFYPTSAAGYMFGVRTIQGKLLTGMFDLILRYMVRRASTVTAASHALVQYAQMAGARIVVHVPNGIPECFLRLHDGRALRDKLGFDQEDLVVGYLGSVEFWLDMRSLIKGVALAKKGGLRVKFLIVGRGLHTDYPVKVLKWIKDEGLEEQTLWLNFIPQDEVPEYMATMDVGTIPFDVSNPTAYFAAPNKIWEYLSQMRPVVSTPIPEVLYTGGCVLIASTPQDYVQKLSLIARKDNTVSSKVRDGYSKAISNTWNNSVKLIASEVYSLVNEHY